MEAQSHLQKEALDCFFKILETAAPHFEIDFWHEILSQVMLPFYDVLNCALLPIKQTVKTDPNSQRQMNFYLNNARVITQTFNSYFFECYDQFKDSEVVTAYFDMLLKFISQDNDKDLTNTICNEIE